MLPIYWPAYWAGYRARLSLKAIPCRYRRPERFRSWYKGYHQAGYDPRSLTIKQMLGE